MIKKSSLKIRTNSSSFKKVYEDLYPQFCHANCPAGIIIIKDSLYLKSPVVINLLSGKTCFPYTFQISELEILAMCEIQEISYKILNLSSAYSDMLYHLALNETNVIQGSEKKNNRDSYGRFISFIVNDYVTGFSKPSQTDKIAKFFKSLPNLFRKEKL